MEKPLEKDKNQKGIKFLTLNLHCFEEEDITEKQATIVEEVIRLDLDIIFLQEVAQYVKDQTFTGNIKTSNYGLKLQEQLRKKGHIYHYSYEPIKELFNSHDEGLAILSKYPINDFEGIYISKTRDYSNWKLRKMIKANVIIDDLCITLVNVHMGWTDEDEVFEDQVDLLVENCNFSAFTIFAGDFNVRPTTKEYAYLISKGFIDPFKNDLEMFERKTFSKATDLNKEKARIDYFFTSKKINVLDRKILFTDKLVSDHYGLYLKIRV